MNQPSYSDMSIGDWLIAIFLSCIPIVGLVCLIYWAVSSSPFKVSRKNWAIAQLILALIITVISVVVLIAVFAVSGTSLFKS